MGEAEKGSGGGDKQGEGTTKKGKEKGEGPAFRGWTTIEFAPVYQTALAARPRLAFSNRSSRNLNPPDK